MTTKQIPAIVPFLWDAIDRCDPTRSHEQKPSARMRESRQFRRIVRQLAATVIAMAGLLAIIAWAPLP